MIVLDVWGGDCSQDHVARYILATDEALTLARNELEAGFLVNMRADAAWGSYRNFDLRVIVPTRDSGAKPS